jgi:hypothetical protein
MLLFRSDLIPSGQNRILLFPGKEAVSAFDWPVAERSYIDFYLSSDQHVILVNRFSQTDIILWPDPEKTGDSLPFEWFRQTGFDIHEIACRQKWTGTDPG